MYSLVCMHAVAYLLSRARAYMLTRATMVYMHVCVCVCVCVCMGAECKNASLSLAVRVVECNAGVLVVFFCAGLFW